MLQIFEFYTGLFEYEIDKKELQPDFFENSSILLLLPVPYYCTFWGGERVFNFKIHFYRYNWAIYFKK